MSRGLTPNPAHAKPPIPTANVMQVTADVGVIVYAAMTIKTVCPIKAGKLTIQKVLEENFI